MLASPNYAYQIYNASNEENPVGSAELRMLYEDWYDDHALNYTYVPFDGRSDYVGFIMNGIPGGGVALGAEGIKTEEEVAMFGGIAGEWYDHCYHQLCDGVDNLDLAAWEVTTKVCSFNSFLYMFCTCIKRSLLLIRPYNLLMPVQLIAHSVATYALSLKSFPKRQPVSMSANEKFLKNAKYRGLKLII